jgi:hypothetical protein
MELLESHAKGLAADLRSRKDDLARDGGCEALNRYATSAIGKVLRGMWLDLPHSTVAATPLWKRAARLLIAVLPLALTFAAEAAGGSVSGAMWIFSATWLLVSHALAVDPERFGRTLRATSAIGGTLKQFAGGEPRSDKTVDEG